MFSSEGADKLFGGYACLKALDEDQLSDELVDITRRLSNTALQRVDRSAISHGLVAHVAFIDSDVVDYALRIPPELKLRREDEVTEKWILRQALTDALPDEVLWRRKRLCSVKPSLFRTHFVWGEASCSGESACLCRRD